ncbi:MAG: helix-hairpin-helix domain-containing protein [Proteobacteria bacterium]|nr:helix-hairpin-helix domain-containing protein [Pseudomonadota bacterium]
MKKEFIVIILVLSLVAIELTYDNRGFPLKEEFSHKRQYVEIVQKGKGRVYPIILSPVTVGNGERLEFLDDGSLLKGPMTGDKLILFGLAIDLNRAGIYDLVAIPGVGYKTAKSIIDRREKEGKFKSLNDLLKVRGIGKKRLDKIKLYLNV